MTGSEQGQATTPMDTAERRRDGTGAAARPARVRRVMRTVLLPDPWRRGRLLAVLALLLGLLMPLHAKVPNRIGNLGSLVESFLPWFGLFIPVLLAGALWRRSASATIALLLPVIVWLHLFGGQFGDRSRPGGDLTVISHNVDIDNPDPAGVARDLAASGADLLALVELTEQTRGTYEQGLAAAYPHHTVQGTVGLWSKLPLSDTRRIATRTAYGPPAATEPDDAELAYNRALRTTVITDRGPLAVYVAHLESVRVNPRGGFWTAQRNIAAQMLANAIAAERNERVMLLGDLNGTVDDRALAGLTTRLRSAQDVAGDGFGFTWPSRFPVVRIDHVLVRGVEPRRSWVLPATGSDHLPVAATISW